jgi:serine/threonine protein kinase
MWSRGFPALVLIVAACAVLIGYGGAGSTEIRLEAAGAAIVLLAAAIAVLHRRAEPPRVIEAPREDSAPQIGPTPVAPSPPVLRTGNYEIVSKIASGGMGEVFLAWQHGPRTFRRHVVLKKLHARFTDDPRIVDMFLNEAQLAAGLSHPNIVPIHELFQDQDGSYLLAMEYICGPTLLAVLRDRSRRRGVGLPYGSLVRVGGAICDALHHAYASPGPDGEPRRIIHRDISPSNVMVRYDGEVKLLDFGLAKVTGIEAASDETLTGKLGYMSPEQLCGETLDHQTDVFSLGVVLWEMATGKRLFRRDSDAQMIHAILRAPLPRPSTVVSTMNPELEEVIMQTLMRDRRQRYLDAAAVARDLRAIAADHAWPRRREDLVALAREAAPRFAADITAGRALIDDVPTAIVPEPSRGTEVVDAVIDARDVEFTDEQSHKTVEHTAILAGRLGTLTSEWHTPH